MIILWLAVSSRWAEPETDAIDLTLADALAEPRDGRDSVHSIDLTTDADLAAHQCQFGAVFGDGPAQASTLRVLSCCCGRIRLHGA